MRTLLLLIAIVLFRALNVQAQVATVVVTPEQFVGPPGSSQLFVANAYDANGNPVVPFAVEFSDTKGLLFWEEVGPDRAMATLPRGAKPNPKSTKIETRVIPGVIRTGWMPIGAESAQWGELIWLKERRLTALQQITQGCTYALFENKYAFLLTDYAGCPAPQ